MKSTSTDTPPHQGELQPREQTLEELSSKFARALLVHRNIISLPPSNNNDDDHDSNNVHQNSSSSSSIASRLALRRAQSSSTSRRSPYIVVVTGAGLSANAGIKTFRGKNGLWTKREQEQEAQQRLAKQNGKEANNTSLHKQKKQSVRHKTAESKKSLVEFLPTFAHRLLKMFVDEGAIKHIISQNIDGLHRRSGVPRSKLSELHGNAFLSCCWVCGSLHEDLDREVESVGKLPPDDYDDVQSMNNNNNNNITRCTTCYERNKQADRLTQQMICHCTGIPCPCCLRDGKEEKDGSTIYLKDTIIHFNECITEAMCKQSEKHVVLADVCVVFGSSLQVEPTASFVNKIAFRGGLVVNVSLPENGGSGCYVKKHEREHDQVNRVGEGKIVRVCLDCDEFCHILEERVRQKEREGVLQATHSDNKIANGFNRKVFPCTDLLFDEAFRLDSRRHHHRATRRNREEGQVEEEEQKNEKHEKKKNEDDRKPDEVQKDDEVVSSLNQPALPKKPLVMKKKTKFSFYVGNYCKLRVGRYGYVEHCQWTIFVRPDFSVKDQIKHVIFDLSNSPEDYDDDDDKNNKSERVQVDEPSFTRFCPRRKKLTVYASSSDDDDDDDEDDANMNNIDSGNEEKKGKDKHEDDTDDDSTDEDEIDGENSWWYEEYILSRKGRVPFTIGIDIHLKNGRVITFKHELCFERAKTEKMVTKSI